MEYANPQSRPTKLTRLREETWHVLRTVAHARDMSIASLVDELVVNNKLPVEAEAVRRAVSPP